MDAIRYFVAFAVVITFPAATLFWILSHGFIRHWRRLGTGRSYTIIALTCLLLEVLIYTQRGWLLERQFGSSYWLLAGAFVFYAGAVWTEWHCRRHLSLKTLIGLPEFEPDRPQALLTDGIYGRLRHPRYLVLMLALISAALFSNYLASYLLVPLFAVLIWFITVLEERELLTRFGDAYREYQRQVPRFLPRLTGRR